MDLDTTLLFGRSQHRVSEVGIHPLGEYQVNKSKFILANEAKDV